MFGLIHDFLTPPANAIGIDFGSDSLRLAQVQFCENGFQLIASSSCQLPVETRGDFEERAQFFELALADLFAQGNFRGRRAIFSLPACMTRIVHAEFPKRGHDARQVLQQSLAFEDSGINADDLVIRAIEISHEPDSDLQQAIGIVARRSQVERLLNAAQNAGIQIVGMNLEPNAIVDCFAHAYSRRSDRNTIRGYIDLGAACTRLTIARDQQILAIFIFPIGGDDLVNAVALVNAATFESARTTLIDAAAERIDRNDVRDLRSETDVSAQCARICKKLVRELSIAIATACENFNQRSSPSKITRLIFIGGGAHHRRICRQIARLVNVPGQIGDPLVGLSLDNSTAVRCGIDRRSPQPDWAVAFGLSLGAALPPVKPTTDDRENAASKSKSECHDDSQR